MRNLAPILGLIAGALAWTAAGITYFKSGTIKWELIAAGEMREQAAGAWELLSPPQGARVWELLAFLLSGPERTEMDGFGGERNPKRNS